MYTAYTRLQAAGPSIQTCFYPPRCHSVAASVGVNLLLEHVILRPPVDRRLDRPRSSDLLSDLLRTAATAVGRIDGGRVEDRPKEGSPPKKDHRVSI